MPKNKRRINEFKKHNFKNSCRLGIKRYSLFGIVRDIFVG